MLTVVHYPILLHLQDCFRYLGGRKGDFSISEKGNNGVLSLSINPFLSTDNIEFISASLDFFIRTMYDK